MPNSISHHWRMMLIAVLIMALFHAVPSKAANVSVALMDDALSALGMVLGIEVDAEDQVWLRGYWRDEASDRPERTAESLEGLAAARDALSSRDDPLILAQLRAQMIDQSFCVAKRTSAINAERLRKISAPEDLVLAQDCVSGAVVTPFDVEAVVASNSLVGEIVGEPADIKAMEAEILAALPGAFSDLPLEQQQRLLWGELRAAALRILWSSVDEATREQLKASARQTFDDYGDLATTAMIFEMTALKSLGDIQVLARKGEHVLKHAEMVTLIEFMTFVTAARLSPLERAEITDIVIRRFHAEPARIISIAGNVRHWLDKGYHFGKDPKTDRIRSWTAEEQARMRTDEARYLYCENAKPADADRLRLNEILFANDPVIDADCAANRLVRESEKVLAESGERRLTRAALDAHRRAFEVIFAFQFTPEERVWFDQTAIEDLRNGSPGLTRALDDFQRLLAEIKAPSRTGPQVNEQRREEIAIQVYCVNRDGEHAHVQRMIEIIDTHDPIIFEDCARQTVVRQSDLEGLIESFNFIASLGGFEPLTAEEIETMPNHVRKNVAAGNGGPPWFRSAYATLAHWWSHMPVAERHRVAATVKQEVASRDDIFVYTWTLRDRASFQAAKLALCDFQKLKLAYDTKRMGLASRTIINTNPMADSPWVNPDAFDDDATFYGVMAPFVQQQCGEVWQ